jgi:hypothetical protein
MLTVPHIAITSNVLVLRALLCCYCSAMCLSFQPIIGECSSARFSGKSKFENKSVIDCAHYRTRINVQ